MRYGHVLVDFDRTLNDSDLVYEKNLEGFLGLTGKEVVKAWGSVHAKVLADEPKERHEDLGVHYQQMAERLTPQDKDAGKRELQGRIEAAQRECWQATALFPEAVPFLLRLADAGYTLHLATGDYGRTKVEAVHRHAGRSLFQQAFDEETLGIGKGTRDYFDRIVQRLGSPPEGLVMIGDSLRNDVCPALAAGLATVWVRRKAEAAKDGVTPLLTVGSLMEALPHFLGGWRQRGAREVNG